MHPAGNKLINARLTNNLAKHPTRLYNHIMSQALHLFRLQKLDSQKDQITSRLAAIEKILAENSLVSNAQNEKTAVEQSLDQARSDLRKAEDIVQAQNIKIEQNESSLYGGKVRNPKELQDLQLEVSSLKKYLVVLEDQQLEAMLTVEDLELKQSQAVKYLSQVENQIAGQHAGLIGERSHLYRDLERIDAERKAVATAISPGNLQVYEQLRIQKGGTAVVAIDDESCTVCGATLTPADRQTARSPSQISRCPNCNRILYAG
jgi:predicted  nucleic acid-binding Zn-ribbon protein